MKKILFLFIILFNLSLACNENVDITKDNYNKYVFVTDDNHVYTIDYNYDGSYRNHFYLTVSKDKVFKVILRHESLHSLMGYVLSRGAKIIKLYPTEGGNK
ncbi:MAG: hypothetical protein ACRCX2_27900 [Paraclostridium sp.]